jgi:hypothetical protein
MHSHQFRLIHQEMDMGKIGDVEGPRPTEPSTAQVDGFTDRRHGRFGVC